MAVDTADKRFSLIGFGNLSFPMGFAPEGSVAEEDRLDLLGLYGGFAVDAPPSVSGSSAGFVCLLLSRRR